MTVIAHAGCVNATKRPRDGDPVLVDGGHGTVEIVSTAPAAGEGFK